LIPEILIYPLGGIVGSYVAGERNSASFIDALPSSVDLGYTLGIQLGPHNLYRSST
ncbi:hypothetical protein FOZ63_028583, partial [Perkinsus olseni]